MSRGKPEPSVKTGTEADSRNFYEKLYQCRLVFCSNFQWGICQKPHKRQLLRRGCAEGAGLRSAPVGAGQAPLALSALCARVQGAQRPCAGQGRQPLPSRSDACVTSYWVLPDAEIGRAGSKAAFLQSCTFKRREGNIGLNETDKA